ncbi:hypothetical protein DRP44_03145 [candidate division TA06 bacterium]|uniref:Secretion system C-terminal sorting domain-containing protein n=1 Tax=candidate division TA06 bacterium TaxID=2250710 RepID=A0A660S8X3_UNCT6|nr:MAG: hypothetical protein DRP44_03145 [candidate division TA06 bacterium]
MKKHLLVVLIVLVSFVFLSAEMTDVDMAKKGIFLQTQSVTDYSTITTNNSPDFGDMDNSSYREGNRWSDDILIMSKGVPTWGVLSTDVDETNQDIYVSLLVPHSGQDDTIYTYRSTDGGRNWSPFWTYQGSSIAGGIIDQEILVGHSTGGTWVYNFMMFDGSGSNSDNGLYVHWMRPDGSDAGWFNIIPGGDSLVRFSVDRNIEDPECFFIAYETNNAHVRRIMSSDSCRTWGNAGYVSSNGTRPSVAAGGDGYVYIAYQDSSSSAITVIRYTNNQISPAIDYFVVDTSSYGIYEPTVAAARTAPGDSQVAWILYSRTNSIGNKSIRRTYTTDGGNSWITPTIWSPVNQAHTTWNMVHPYIRVSYNSDLARAVATIRETDFDSLVYAYSTNDDPDTWSGRAILNEHRMTGEFSARVSYSNDCLGGYIVYREYNSANIWFDAYNWTGIKTSKTTKNSLITLNLAPNPAKGKTTLSYTLTEAGNVSIALFDIKGSLVKSIYNGYQNPGNHSINIEKHLLPGIYFIKLNAGSSTYTKSLTILD